MLARSYPALGLVLRSPHLCHLSVSRLPAFLLSAFVLPILCFIQLSQSVLIGFFVLIWRTALYRDFWKEEEVR